MTLALAPAMTALVASGFGTLPYLTAGKFDMQAYILLLQLWLLHLLLSRLSRFCVSLQKGAFDVCAEIVALVSSCHGNPSSVTHLTASTVLTLLCLTAGGLFDIQAVTLAPAAAVRSPAALHMLTNL